VRTLARLHNVTCKLSGLVTEADWRNWTPGTLRPYVDVALDAFGPERLMFGSDWPVCLVASSHRRWVEVVEALLAPLTAMQRQAVFGDNAARVYRLRD
jgi:L-fuconolactonase